MDVDHVQSVNISVQGVSEQEKEKWVEEHARRLQRLFEQWQKPLGIKGEQYRNHLKEELPNLCDDPLLRSLIESIT